MTSLPREHRGLIDRRGGWLAAMLHLLLYVLALSAGTAPAGAGDGTLDPPLFRGRSSQFMLLDPPGQAPTSSVRRLDGRAIDLSAFRGKVVLLNFWATWCRPCIDEMPSLDRLAASYPSDRLVVAAVSIDRAGAEAVVPFLARFGLAHVPVYVDPGQRLGRLGAADDGTLALLGLPTSYIVGGDGRVYGLLIGPADWDSRGARAFLDYFIRQTVR